MPAAHGAARRGRPFGRPCTRTSSTNFGCRTLVLRARARGWRSLCSRPMAPEAVQWSRSLADLRLVVLDVDGVLTDGRVVYAGAEEVQSFHVHDGAAIVWLLRAGLQMAWITGRGSKATETRARELGVVELHQRAGPKQAVLEALQARLG